ncbi:MAG: tetratricopeptide repeat protein [Bacteroidales bacterium]|nr:tetratricopeptide repeat protein [Bacteroidales bacterium]
MHKTVINLILIIFILNVSPISGQTKKEIKEMFYEAEAFILYEEYNEAIPFYEALLNLFPDNDNYKYRLGMCYLNMPGEKETSLGFLQAAVQNINPKYREGRFKETAAPYDALYYLGNAYLVTNQIDKAIATFNRFSEGMDQKKYNPVIVENQIEACYNAIKLMEVPLFLKSVNQGEIINERFSEVNPVVSADENTLVYTREAQLQDMILFSRKIDGEWTPGIVIMDQLLVDEGYSTSLSGDGNELFLYKNDQYVGNIYSSRYINERWIPAEKLNENINTKYWESHASVSSNGQKLFFTSNRPDGYGGLDIYMSNRDSLNSWGPAVNLGPNINTPFNEETPFLDKTDKVLYFSSRGHFNMGGHDVFYSTLLDNGEWSVPVNMGYPVNSTDDDTFFSPVGEGYVAYVSRFDPEGYGKRDIHRVEIFSDDHPRKFFVRGMVKLRDLLEQFSDSVKISALNRENLDTLLIVYSDPATGEYEFEIPHGKFQVVYDSEGSEQNVTDLDLDLTREGDNIILQDKELPKSDLFAEFNIISNDSLPVFFAGDTTIINLAVEPSSILIVEHWQGDSLILTEEFINNDSQFDYNMIPVAGDNKIVFTIKDRFNNITTREYLFSVVKPVVIPVDIIDPDILLAEALLQDSLELAAQQEVIEVKDPTIDQMDQIISEVTDDTGEHEMIRDAIEKINEKNIKNAGEWLESLYSVALDDGAEKEMLTRLIAALSANKNEPVDEYLSRLAEFTGDNLLRTINSIDFEVINAENPEDIIDYLLSNCTKHGYTRQEVFEAFAKLISHDKKSAEEIVDYIKSKERGKLWILWLLLGGGATIFFIIWSRKKKKEKNGQ